MTWFSRLLVTTFFVHSGLHAVRLMSSYRALEIGAGPLELGLVTSGFALASLVLAIPIGRSVDLRGGTRLIAAGAAVMAAASVGLIWVNDIALLVALQAALGLGHMLNLVATQALIANRGSAPSRPGRFGRFTVVVSIGQFVGPGAAGFIAGGATHAADWDSAPSLVFCVAAALFACGAAVASTLWVHDAVARLGLHGSRPSRPVPIGRIVTLPGIPQAMLSGLTVLAAIDILVAYLPAYGEANGISVEMVGILLSARAAASVASRLAVARLVARFGSRPVLIASMAFAASALLLAPLLDSMLLLLAMMVCIGLGLGIGQPLTLAWVAARAPAGSRGAAVAIRLGANRMGQLVVPVMVGAVAVNAGIGWIFITMAVLLGSSTVLVIGAPMADDSDATPDGPLSAGLN